MHPESLIRIELSKEYLNFSAGHFTIFSATERENLHGHNFQVRGAVTAAIVGMRSAEQAKGVLGALEFRLSPEEIAEIDQAR